MNIKITMCVALLALWSCAHSDKSIADQRAIAVWNANEKIFKDALNGHQKNDEFDKACLFFENTTGLTLHLDYFTFGVLPTPETSQDLIRIQAWFKANKSRLYWDETTHSVKVRNTQNST